MFGRSSAVTATAALPPEPDQGDELRIEPVRDQWARVTGYRITLADRVMEHGAAVEAELTPGGWALGRWSPDDGRYGSLTPPQIGRFGWALPCGQRVDIACRRGLRLRWPINQGGSAA